VRTSKDFKIQKIGMRCDNTTAVLGFLYLANTAEHIYPEREFSEIGKGRVEYLNIYGNHRNPICII
jgi:hypothetical protein